MAKKKGLDAIAITDHNRLFSRYEARRLSREFGIVVIPGIEGGNIAVERHWIALGIDTEILRQGIIDILALVRAEGGVSIAPHPHSRLGFEDYAHLGFDAVESLNGSAPESNRMIRNHEKIPEIAGSDSHASQMMGFCWTEVDADDTTESILAAVVRGICKPAGRAISPLRHLRFYPQYFRDRVLCEPSAAFAAAYEIFRDIRKTWVRDSFKGTHS